MRYALILAAVLLACVDCADRKPSATEDRVVKFEDDDAAMNRAIAKAKGSVATFIEAIKAPKPSHSGFAIKYPFDYDIPGEKEPGCEHIWLSEVTYDGEAFHALVANDPVSVKNIKSGDAKTVKPSEISDWMYLDGDKLIGGETIRVIVQQMSPEERKDFDANAPFKL